MSTKLNLTIPEILDKQFSTDFKGYSMQEIDEFLDMVMEDYDTYEEMVKELTLKITELERINASMKAKMIELEGKANVVQEGTLNNSQIDILKRLSRLEQAVYKNQQ